MLLRKPFYLPTAEHAPGFVCCLAVRIRLRSKDQGLGFRFDALVDILGIYWDNGK